MNMNELNRALIDNYDLLLKGVEASGEDRDEVTALYSTAVSLYNLKNSKVGNGALASTDFDFYSEASGSMVRQLQASKSIREMIHPVVLKMFLKEFGTIPKHSFISRMLFADPDLTDETKTGITEGSTREDRRVFSNNLFSFSNKIARYLKPLVDQGIDIDLFANIIQQPMSIWISFLGESTQSESIQPVDQRVLDNVKEIESITIENVISTTGTELFDQTTIDNPNNDEQKDIKLIFDISKLLVYLRMKANEKGIGAMNSQTFDTFVDFSPGNPFTEELYKSKTFLTYLMEACNNRFPLPAEYKETAIQTLLSLALTEDSEVRTRLVSGLDAKLIEVLKSFTKSIFDFLKNPDNVSLLKPINDATRTQDLAILGLNLILGFRRTLSNTETKLSRIVRPK